MTGLFAVSFLPLVLGDPRIVFLLDGSAQEGMGMLMVFCGIFPLCALTGYLTPQLIDTYSRGRPEQGGRAYAINIIGCVIGPVLASYVLLPYLGIKWSLVLLSIPFMLLHLFYHLRSGLHERRHDLTADRQVHQHRPVARRGVHSAARLYASPSAASTLRRSNGSVFDDLRLKCQEG